MELKFLVASDISSFRCVFKSRVCNRAAHELATLGLGSAKGEEHITCNIPDNVRVIVVDDM